MGKKIIDTLAYGLEKFDPFIMKYLVLFKIPHINKIAFLIISAGCGLILSAINPPWFPFAAGAMEQKLGISISQGKETVDWALIAAGILVVLMGSGLMVLKMRLDYIEKHRKKTTNLLQIRHQSIENVTDFGCIKDDLSEYQITMLLLDQTSDMTRGIEKSIESALDKQAVLVSDAKAFINKGTNYETVYMGLAHIPLVFLAGFQLGDKFKPDFFEWNQNMALWEKITDNDSDYPKLSLHPNQDIGQSHVDGDIVIKIGITYPIDDCDLAALNKPFIKTFYLKIEKPERNAIKSARQLQEYKKTFRELLDAINQNYLGVKNIHIFYSGQTSVAFMLGSALSERMDANIYVYNHNRNADVRYAWSIKMFKKYKEVSDVFFRHGC
jgi:hypothetical protein